VTLIGVEYQTFNAAREAEFKLAFVDSIYDAFNEQVSVTIRGISPGSVIVHLTVSAPSVLSSTQTVTYCEFISASTADLLVAALTRDNPGAFTNVRVSVSPSESCIACSCPTNSDQSAAASTSWSEQNTIAVVVPVVIFVLVIVLLIGFLRYRRQTQKRYEHPTQSTHQQRRVLGSYQFIFF
jgi:hypothetical protein